MSKVDVPSEIDKLKEEILGLKQELKRMSHATQEAERSKTEYMQNVAHRGGLGSLDRGQGFISGNLLRVRVHAAACLCS